MTNTPFTERQAKYAAWREQMRTQSASQRIDLSAAEKEPEPLSEWSTESLFASSRAIADAE